MKRTFKALALSAVLFGMAGFGFSGTTEAASFEASGSPIAMLAMRADSAQVQELSAWPRIRDTILGRNRRPAPPPPPQRHGWRNERRPGGPGPGPIRVNHPGPGPRR